MRRCFASASLVVVLALGSTIAADAPKSGPQVGDDIPGPFNVLNVNGSQAGKSNCQVWRNGNNPVAMIFAREISAPLTSLVKKIDAATASNSKCKMGSFVVFVGASDDLQKQIKDLAEKESIKNTVLATMTTPSGPEKYKVAKDADVTVVLYNKRKVEANYSFEKGKLTDADVEKIVKDVSKILPKEKKK